MYLPTDDSFLLAESAKQYAGDAALEIGVGSGIVLKVLYNNFKIVVGTDISLVSLRYCKRNLPSNILLACSDAASAFHHRFDLIVTNPPYLPDSEDKNKDVAVSGGPTGIETILHFIKSGITLLNPSGKMLTIISTMSNISKMDELLMQIGLKRRIINQKNLFFETLSTVEISAK